MTAGEGKAPAEAPVVGGTLRSKREQFSEDIKEGLVSLHKGSSSESLDRETFGEKVNLRKAKRPKESRKSKRHVGWDSKDYHHKREGCMKRESSGGKRRGSGEVITLRDSRKDAAYIFRMRGDVV